MIAAFRHRWFAFLDSLIDLFRVGARPVDSDPDLLPPHPEPGETITFG